MVRFMGKTPCDLSCIPQRGVRITHRESPGRLAESENYRADFGISLAFDESASAAGDQSHRCVCPAGSCKINFARSPFSFAIRHEEISTRSSPCMMRLCPTSGIGTVVMTNATGFDVRNLLDETDCAFLRPNSSLGNESRASCELATMKGWNDLLNGRLPARDET
jgi:hypothetical protein